MKHPEYNKKAFLLSDSLSSMACYHAKVDNKGIYKLTIHDCNTSIRLWGDLNDAVQLNEAVEKLRVLAIAAGEFSNFIEENYLNTSTI